MTTIHPTPSDPLHDILRDLDAHEDTKATVTIEARRYGKAVTVVEGLDDRRDVHDILKTLKHALATGGSAKDGRIELQGDHRRRAVAILVARGIQIRP